MKTPPSPLLRLPQRRHRIPWTAAGLLLLPLWAGPLTGDPFTVTGAVSGGGGRISGGGYSIQGAVAQTATDSSRGGPYQLSGGLFGVVIVPGEVRLTLERMPDGQTRLSWPADATGFVLQSRAQFGAGPDWQPVVPAPTGNSFITPTDQPLRLFRLHKP